MKVSRRDFLGSSLLTIATMQVPIGAEAGLRLHGGVPAAPTGHKAQVGLTVLDPESYGQDFPFIDCGKMMTSWQCNGSGITNDIFAHLNSNGFPTGFPSGGTDWRCQTKCYLTAKNATTGNWILDWDGTATIDAQAGGGSGQPGIAGDIISSTANSINYNFYGVNSTDVTFTATFAPETGGTGRTIMTVTGATNGTVWPGQRLSAPTGVPAGLSISSIVPGSGTIQGNNGTYYVNNPAFDLDPFTQATPVTITLYAYLLGEAVDLFIHVSAVTTAPTKIRLYRIDEASLLAAGQITAPHFISFFQQYGCLRYMDWLLPNTSTLVQWQDRPTISNYSWLGKVLTAYLGIMSQTSGTNDYTPANNLSGAPTSWTDGMLVQACFPSVPTTVSITAISTGTTTTITAPGHGFSAGQHIFFPISNLTSTGSGNSIQQELSAWATNGTTSSIPYAGDYIVGTVSGTSFTLAGVDSSGWQTYVSGGDVGAALRVKTATLPAKRVIAMNSQAMYLSTLQNVLSGNLIGGVPFGTPWSFVYNAAIDALLMQLGPQDDNGVKIGTPYEVIVQMSNEIGVAPWICIPTLASDNYVSQLATYLFNNLNTSLRVRLELSNEVWNGNEGPAYGMSQTLGGLQLGIYNAAGDFGGSNVGVAGWQWTSSRFYNMMTQVNTVFAGAMNRVYRVLAANGNTNNNTFYTTNFFEAPNAGLGSAKPYQHADALAIAPYLEGDRTNFPTAQTVYNFKIGNTSAAFSAADTWFNTTPTDGIVFSINLWGGGPSNATLTFWAGIAAQYGLEMHEYEGGWGVYPTADQVPTSYNPGTGSVTLTQADTVAFWQGYKASTNWGTQIAAALAGYKAAGGKFASNYLLVNGYWNFNNMFGAYGPNIFGAPLPYYMASQPTPEKAAFDAYNAS